MVMERPNLNKVEDFDAVGKMCPCKKITDINRCVNDQYKTFFLKKT